MIRRRQVFPDADGVVSRDALLLALMGAAEMLDFAGGVITVVTQRAPTNLRGEMVTVGAVVEWRHSTMVQPGPNQFEEPTTEGALDEVAVVESEERNREALAEQGPLVDPDDGFDYSQLPDEDLDESTVPAA